MIMRRSPATQYEKNPSEPAMWLVGGLSRMRWRGIRNLNALLPESNGLDVSGQTNFLVMD